MNKLYIVLVLFSGVSFIGYGSLLFVSPQMRDEFRRFGLEKFATLTGILELLGGLGMLIGLKFGFILLISSGGLALLMLMGFIVRLKMKDSLAMTFPSLIFLLLNLFLFINAF